MRKSKAETAETRRRIVRAAADAFRRHGIEGTSVNELMSDAGLTHGGFYRHFSSKNQLVREACTGGLEAMIETLRERCPDACPATSPAATGAQRLGVIADAFLSTDHRDERVAACPLVTLGSEIARADADTRRVATDSLCRTIDLLARQFAHPDASPDTSPAAADIPADARSKAVATMSTMVGAVTLARLVDDPALSDTILRDARALIGEMARGGGVTPPEPAAASAAHGARKAAAAPKGDRPARRGR